MEPIIRRRRVEDSDALAHAIATVWNTTYQGIVEDDFLQGLLSHEKESADKLRESVDRQPNYYVLMLDKQLIGWVYFTLESDHETDAAEIHSLYVLKEYQKRGYGKQLYEYAIQKIREEGRKKVVIGCLEKNPSNQFYQHLGGKYIGNHLFRDKYIENLYLFEI